MVIPKEIRRTMRIREGDPLEIFTDNDGEVVFKKYSPIGELSPFAGQYADVMSRACGMAVLICDRDHVVAAAGISKKEFQERPGIRTPRRTDGPAPDLSDRGGGCEPGPAGRRQRPGGAVDGADPRRGGVIGAVCMLLPDSGAVPNEGDVRLAQVAAAFLGKQMEE